MAERISTSIPTASATKAASLARRSTEPETVFVELGQVAKAAQIARDGVALPVLAVDNAALLTVLAGTPRVQAKVVTQNIAAGVSVSPGSTIDIVLAEPERLPASIIQDAHVVLAERTIGQISDQFIRNNEAVRRVVARNPTALTLSDVDRGVIREALAVGGVETSNEPGRTIENAFGVLQAAYTFG